MGISEEYVQSTRTDVKQSERLPGEANSVSCDPSAVK
jgi:hypothetical protein